MPERDACLVVSGSSWFEISERVRVSGLEQHEYKLRCRIILDEPRSVTVRIFEVADTSRQFSTLVPKQIMKDAGLPRKLPRQVDTSMPIRCARHHSAKASAVSSGPLSQ